MPITSDLLKATGRLTPSGEPGRWRIEPPLEVIAQINDNYTTKGEVYSTAIFDEKGKYPNCLHLREAGCWTLIGYLELKG